MVSQVDLDISWIADPQPLFSTALYARHDLLFQSELAHGFNAGFYLARPTAAAVNLLEAWVRDLARQAGSKSFEEQHSLGRSIKHVLGSSIHHLRIHKLNHSQFPNGKLWWEQGQPREKREAYMVHCNWVKSNKKGRLVRDNLWALDKLDEKCAANWDPHAGGCTRLCRPVQYCKPGHSFATPSGCPQESCKKLLSPRAPWHPMAQLEAGCTNQTGAPD